MRDISYNAKGLSCIAIAIGIILACAVDVSRPAALWQAMTKSKNLVVLVLFVVVQIVDIFWSCHDFV